ncbi:MAG: hypothetical protein N2691_03485 [Patescibacteria group bacterium]|nr:hypothetical protein [Patescibacteria group bacterium]
MEKILRAFIGMKFAELMHWYEMSRDLHSRLAGVCDVDRAFAPFSDKKHRATSEGDQVVNECLDQIVADQYHEIEVLLSKLVERHAIETMDRTRDRLTTEVSFATGQNEKNSMVIPGATNGSVPDMKNWYVQLTLHHFQKNRFRFLCATVIR